jgi:DNA-binding MarR family transcriptional regulator
MSNVSDIDLIRMLLGSQRALSAELAHALEERGYPDVRPGHASVFLYVDRRSGTRLTQLAHRTRMTKQGMMLLVDDLESRGYVRRAPDPDDARAKVVKLTAHGRRAATECRKAVQMLETRTRRLLGERRYEALQEALDTITASEGALE